MPITLVFIAAGKRVSSAWDGERVNRPYTPDSGASGRKDAPPRGISRLFQNNSIFK